MKPLRILHLEDDQNDALLVDIQFDTHHWPHETVLVGSQVDFSAAIENGPYDLILADHSGPSFSGHDALEIVRSKSPDAVFLFVSGGPEPGLAAPRDEGSDGFVSKDRLSELIPAVQRALESKKK